VANQNDKLPNALRGIQWALSFFLAWAAAAVVFPMALSAAVQAGRLSNSEGQSYLFIALMVGGVAYLPVQLNMAWAAYRAASPTGGGGRTVMLTLLGLLPTVCLGVLAYLWSDLRKRSSQAT
jgi:hypothetical protein